MRIKRGLLFSHGEENTYGILRDFFGGRPYVVYKEVSLSQVIDAGKEELTDREWSYYRAASFDFLVCRDDSCQTVELAVEFDSAFHDNPDRTWKDDLKNRLCDVAGLPLMRVRSEHVLKREGIPLLRYMLQLHYGEKAVQTLVKSGRLSPDEEYFPGTQFEAVTEIQKRLVSRGVFPTAVPLLAKGTDPQTIHWYRVSIGSSHLPGSSDSATNVGAAKVELLQGWQNPEVVAEIERTVSLKNCAPRSNVLGVHGWFIANEFALYLCFQELERQLVKGLGGVRGCG